MLAKGAIYIVPKPAAAVGKQKLAAETRRRLLLCCGSGRKGCVQQGQDDTCCKATCWYKHWTQCCFGDSAHEPDMLTRCPASDSLHRSDCLVLLLSRCRGAVACVLPVKHRLNALPSTAQQSVSTVARLRSCRYVEFTQRGRAVAVVDGRDTCDQVCTVVKGVSFGAKSRTACAYVTTRMCKSIMDARSMPACRSLGAARIGQISETFERDLPTVLRHCFQLELR